ncbi:MAG: Sua5 YciO YrdC YwlC family protein [Campylobacter sp.]|nr:Sua5 YciO YrdC YwlC family protein [Campylobacter sp.]
MIYLAQTDTTAGLLSKDPKKLNLVKERDLNTPCILTTSKFSGLRVPKKFKNSVRRLRKTTFIYPNSKSIRVVKECEHVKFLDKMGDMYSTSANLSGMKFDEEWARSVADEIEGEDFKEGESSKIYKISRSKIRKIR